jgi:hypothetical protein
VKKREPVFLFSTASRGFKSIPSMAIVSVALLTAEADASQSFGRDKFVKKGTATSSADGGWAPDWALTGWGAGRSTAKQQADRTKFLSDMMLLKLPIKVI